MSYSSTKTGKPREWRLNYPPLVVRWPISTRLIIDSGDGASTSSSRGPAPRVTMVVPASHFWHGENHALALPDGLRNSASAAASSALLKGSARALVLAGGHRVTHATRFLVMRMPARKVGVAPFNLTGAVTRRTRDPLLTLALAPCARRHYRSVSSARPACCRDLNVGINPAARLDGPTDVVMRRTMSAACRVRRPTQESPLEQGALASRSRAGDSPEPIDIRESVRCQDAP